MTLWTVAVAALVSVVVLTIPQPAHLDAVRARASIETAITLFALASAALLLARFNHTRSLRDLALLSACAAISVTQLAFGALPALGYLTMPATAADWVTSTIVLRLIASAAVLSVAIMKYSDSRRAATAQALNLERQRIAGDLHDGLAQDLAFIVSQTQHKGSALGPDYPLSVAARGALAVSRGAINDLSCSTAPLTGAALHQLAEELEARFGVAVKVHIAGDPETENRPLLDADGREHLVRIAREAIVNAARHGGARRIDVALERRMDGVRMCVRDDGCGIGENPVDRHSGFGLPAMRSRAAALGGQLTARALPEGGTEIEAHIPGKAPHRGQAGSQARRRTVARLPAAVAVSLIALVSFASIGSAARPRHPQRSPGHVRQRIWVPAPHSTWQWQLTTPVDMSVRAKVYDIDLFDNPASVVATLHRKGRRVICYLDAGTYENFRPDATQFPKSVLGNTNGWPGERWLDIRRLSVLAPIMRARFELCKHKGFDAVEADNVDGYANGSGFPLTASDQLRYNKWLAHTAHSLGLSIALKNDVGQVAQLEPYFDFELDEQCFQYSECSQLHPFIAAHKAVFEVEYNLAPSHFCAGANADGFMAMRKDLNLGAKRAACWH
jgi:signal transduction histidine kinase